MEPSHLEALVGAAAGLVLIAVVAWVRNRRAATGLLHSSLRNGDPAVRRAAVFLAAQEGLEPYAKLLTERCRDETDPAVLDALAEVVLRNQWEPAANPRLVELRLWAHGHLGQDNLDPPVREAAEAAAVEHEAPAAETPVAETPVAETPAESTLQMTLPERRNPHDDAQAGRGFRGEPPPLLSEHAPVATNGHAPVAAAVGVPIGSVGAATVGVEPPPTPRARPEPVARPAPRPMPQGAAIPVRPRRPTTAIVTGAGGPAGVAVIQALTAAGYRAVAVDVDGLAAGMRLSQDAYCVPRSDDPTFADAICEVAATTGASLLVPTITEELMSLHEFAEDLAALGVATWLPSPNAIDTCIDKWKLASVLAAAGVSIPPTNLGSAHDVPGDWVVKPRRGRGSRDVYIVSRAEELDWALRRVPEPIVQTRLSGREFTVDVLVDRDGTVAGAVPRWRLETKAGISTKGRTFNNLPLVEAVARVVGAIGLTGPANVQGFMAADGVATFVEVNPRFSGGLPLSQAAGADLVGEYVRAVLGGAVRPDRLSFRAGVTMIRRMEEHFE